MVTIPRSPRAAVTRRPSQRPITHDSEPRIRSVTRELWEQLITEAGRHPVAVTPAVLAIVGGLEFRDIVVTCMHADHSDDLDDGAVLTKLLRGAFEETAVAESLPTYIRDPFWRGADVWESIDRQCDDRYYHHRGWKVSYASAACGLCWRYARSSSFSFLLNYANANQVTQ